MPSLVTTSQTPNTPPVKFPSQLRIAMKKIFGSRRNSDAQILVSTPTTPNQVDKSRSSRHLPIFGSRRDDTATLSSRDKSVEGRPASGSSGSVVHLPLTAKASDTPRLSFNRPSMPPSAHPQSQSAPKVPPLPHKTSASNGSSLPQHSKSSQPLPASGVSTPRAVPVIDKPPLLTPIPNATSVSAPPTALLPPSASSSASAAVSNDMGSSIVPEASKPHDPASDGLHGSIEGVRLPTSGDADSVDPTPSIQATAVPSVTRAEDHHGTLFAGPESIPSHEPSQIASAMSSSFGLPTLPVRNSSGQSQLRLRLNSETLPPRLPPLPLPSPFASEFGSSPVSGLPDSAYGPASAHPFLTPTVPGAFDSEITPAITRSHSRNRSSTLPSPASPTTLRRLANASNHSTYVMPSGVGTSGTTLKMNPSLVLSKPSMPLPATPMRFPSLLVSGVSGGDRDGTSGSGYNGGSTISRSRTEGEPTPRPMRSALPALRRDGSSTWMMTRNAQQPSTGERGRALPNEEEDGSDSDGDIINPMDMEEGMEGMASDDEEDNEQSSGRILGGMAKAVKALAGPLTPGSLLATPKGVTSPMPQTPGGSYFRLRPLRQGSSSSRSGDVGNSTPVVHRMSLVSAGAPSQLLGTVHDEHDHEEAPDRVSVPIPKGTPAAAAATPRKPLPDIPAARRPETLYHTPPHTPTIQGGARDTLYFDAEEHPVPQAARPPLEQAQSAATVRPSMDSTITNTPSPRSDESALGLDVAAGSVDQRASSVQPLIALPESAKDYFSRPAGSSSRPGTGSTARTPGGNPPLPRYLHTPMELDMGMRTPGGRPGFYHQASHSMLDFSSVPMMDDSKDVPPVPRMSPLHGKGKGKGKGKEMEPIPEPASRTASPVRSKSRRNRHHTISRRRSLPDMSGPRAPPPPYPKFSAREEEGKEALPPYTCRIHFEASVMRKMEFSRPGVLSQDRSWRRVYVILNGTSLRIFKNNPRMHAVKRKHFKTGAARLNKEMPEHTPGGRNGDGVVSTKDVVVGAPHVHLPEEVLIAATADAGVPLRRTTSRTSSNSGGTGSGVGRRSLDALSRPTRRSLDTSRRSAAGRSSMSSSGHMTGASTPITSPASSSAVDLSDIPDDSGKERLPPNPPGPTAVYGQQRPSNSQTNTGSSIFASLQSNQLIRHYSLQNAETGLASDYHKRQNVIRVRSEGEQFLIQADNVLMAIDWIETFQAGASVSLDLDDRPMPKVPALPRRRRRRRTNAGEGGQQGDRPAEREAEQEHGAEPSRDRHRDRASHRRPEDTTQQPRR